MFVCPLHYLTGLTPLLLPLHPVPCAGGKQLFVCSNDSTIKVYRLPDMQQLTRIRCQVRGEGA